MRDPKKYIGVRYIDLKKILEEFSSVHIFQRGRKVTITYTCKLPQFILNHQSRSKYSI